MQKNDKSEGKIDELLWPRDAAVQLGISLPTIQQWIYKKKIRSDQTTGGHHRILQSEVDRLLFRTWARPSRNAKKKSGA